MAETKVINLEVKTNSASLKAQLREAQNEVNALADKFGATSQEAINAAKRAAELKDAIGDAKALTDSFNPDAKFNALSNSIGGVLNGFQAFEGALGLVGVEGEEVQKTLLKVQSAMALSQGLQGLGESIDSFKQLGAVIKSTTIYQSALSVAQGAYSVVVGTSTGALKAFRIALAATGIGAIIVALGLAAQAMGLFGDSSEETAEKVKKLKEQQKAYKEQLQKELDLLTKLRAERKGGSDELESQIRILKAKGASDKQIYEAERELIRKQLDELSFAEGFKGKLDLEERKRKRQLKTDLIVLDAEYYREVKEKAAKAEEDRKQRAKENRDKQLAETKAHNKQLQDLEDERFRLHQEATYSQEQLEIAKLVEQYDSKFAIANGNSQLEIELQTKLKEEIAAISDKYRKSDVEETKKTEEAKIEIAKATEEQKLQAVKDGFNTISNLAQLFAGKSEKAQKRAFDIQKAANIANTLIDTYQSATSSYKSLSGIPYVGPVLGFAAAGAAVAAGLANVKNIASQQFGDRTLKTSDTPSPNKPSLTQQPPTFNVIGQTAQTQIAQSQQPIRAFVVSNEVTTQQALDRNRLRNATL